MSEASPQHNYIPVEAVLEWANETSAEIGRDRERLQGVIERRPEVELEPAPLFARGQLVGKRAVLAGLQHFLSAQTAEARMADSDDDAGPARADGQLYLF